MVHVPPLSLLAVFILFLNCSHELFLLWKLLCRYSALGSDRHYTSTARDYRLVMSATMRRPSLREAAATICPLSRKARTMA
ncbi:hypothetical protein B0H10DRAFT_1990173 [Mycena sp. CBHHK59/15]|nr:hypothetical protein B0H10DRAFT_2085712 [Mycena sp. CBHHK59/15]KAJ6628501.1 hypothetical protein B0H10DRAFT_1990173 [Mycena sp. CBHHK59/15]